MTPQEQQLLQDMTNRVNSTVLHDKDAEAEQFLAQSLGRNPDALYILAQTVLVQQYALEQAKKQLEDLRSAPQPPERHTSFLGNLLGMNQEPTHAAPPPPRPQDPPPYQPVQYTQQPQYGGQPYPGSAYAGNPQPGMMPQGGFLRNAMQTATGVAAGALAFEGIESLMHGFGNHAGYGGGSGFGQFGGGMGGGPREEVVNNYYGDSAHEHGGQQGLSPDIEDRRDDSNFDSALAQNDPDDFAASSDDTGSFDQSLAQDDPDDFTSSDDDSNS